MKSETFVSRQSYLDLIASYLAGQMQAGVLTRSFFEQRRYDLDKTAETLGLPADVRERRWEELYSELFMACEDLDLDFESLGPRSEYAIPESEFKKRIEDIQSRLHTLLAAPRDEPHAR